MDAFDPMDCSPGFLLLPWACCILLTQASSNIDFCGLGLYVVQKIAKIVCFECSLHRLEEKRTVWYKEAGATWWVRCELCLCAHLWSEFAVALAMVIRVGFSKVKVRWTYKLLILIRRVRRLLFRTEGNGAMNNEAARNPPFYFHIHKTNKH